MSLRGECFPEFRGDACPVVAPSTDERTCMTGWKVTAAKVIAMVGLLIAGIGVSAAFADPGNGNGNGPPTTVPGSPGDDCSHGNSGSDCRPDPNQNGKDCEDHGNARGNEDHCDAVETTTTTETSTTSTTTTGSTTTTNPGSPGSPPGNNGSPSSPPGGPQSPSASAPPVSKPPVSKPQLQKELAHQVKAAHAVRSSRGSTKPGELPFTGFPAWAFALVGSLLLGAGLGLRRYAS
jgi:hypothetical protein